MRTATAAEIPPIAIEFDKRILVSDLKKRPTTIDLINDRC
jgi:hypothetical protein